MSITLLYASSSSFKVTVTVTVADAAATPSASAVTVIVGGSSTAAAPVASSTASPNDIGDFGKCSVPQIEFGVGFDNRKETSFEPVDKSA